MSDQRDSIYESPRGTKRLPKPPSSRHTPYASSVSTVLPYLKKYQSRDEARQIISPRHGIAKTRVAREPPSVKTAWKTPRSPKQSDIDDIIPEARELEMEPENQEKEVEIRTMKPLLLPSVEAAYLSNQELYPVDLDALSRVNEKFLEITSTALNHADSIQEQLPNLEQTSSNTLAAIEDLMSQVTTLHQLHEDAKQSYMKHVAELTHTHNEDITRLQTLNDQEKELMKAEYTSEIADLRLTSQAAIRDLEDQLVRQRQELLEGKRVELDVLTARFTQEYNLLLESSAADQVQLQEQLEDEKREHERIVCTLQMQSEDSLTALNNRRIAENVQVRKKMKETKIDFINRLAALQEEHESAEMAAKKSAVAELELARTSHAHELNSVIKSYELQLSNLNQQHVNKIDAMSSESSAREKSMSEEFETRHSFSSNAHKQEMHQTVLQYEAKLNELRQACEEDIAELRHQHAEQIAGLRETHAAQVLSLETTVEELNTQMTNDKASLTNEITTSKKQITELEDIAMHLRDTIKVLAGRTKEAKELSLMTVGEYEMHIVHHKEVQEKLASKLKCTEMELQQAHAELLSKANEIITLNDTVQRREDEIQKLHAQLLNTIQTGESTNEVLNETSGHLQSRTKELETTKAALRLESGRLSRAEESMQAKDSMLEDSTQKVESLTMALETFRTETKKLQMEMKLQAEHAQTDIELKNAEIQRLQTIQTDLQTKCSEYQAAITQLESDVRRIEKQREEGLRRIDLLQAEAEHREESIRSGENTLVDKDKIISQLKQQKKKVDVENSRLEATLSSRKEKIKALQTEIERRTMQNEEMHTRFRSSVEHIHDEQLARRKSERNLLLLELDGLKDMLKQYQGVHEKLVASQTDVADLTEERNTLAKEIVQLQTNLETVESEKELEEEKLAAITIQLQQAQQYLHAYQQEKEVTAALCRGTENIHALGTDSVQQYLTQVQHILKQAQVATCSEEPFQLAELSILVSEAAYLKQFFDAIMTKSDESLPSPPTSNLLHHEEISTHIQACHDFQRDCRKTLDLPTRTSAPKEVITLIGQLRDILAQLANLHPNKQAETRDSGKQDPDGDTYLLGSEIDIAFDMLNELRALSNFSSSLVLSKEGTSSRTAKDFELLKVPSKTPSDVSEGQQNRFSKESNKQKRLQRTKSFPDYNSAEPLVSIENITSYSPLLPPRIVTTGIQDDEKEMMDSSHSIDMRMWLHSPNCSDWKDKENNLRPTSPTDMGTLVKEHAALLDFAQRTFHLILPRQELPSLFEAFSIVADQAAQLSASKEDLGKQLELGTSDSTTSVQDAIPDKPNNIFTKLEDVSAHLEEYAGLIELFQEHPEWLSIGETQPVGLESMAECVCSALKRQYDESKERHEDEESKEFEALSNQVMSLVHVALGSSDNDSDSFNTIAAENRRRRYAGFVSGLEAVQTVLTSLQNDLASTQDLLQMTVKNKEEIEIDLGVERSKMIDTQSQLRVEQSQLMETQTELQLEQNRLIETHAELQETILKLNTLARQHDLCQVSTKSAQEIPSDVTNPVSKPYVDPFGDRVLAYELGAAQSLLTGLLIQNSIQAQCDQNQAQGQYTALEAEYTATLKRLLHLQQSHADTLSVMDARREEIEASNKKVQELTQSLETATFHINQFEEASDRKIKELEQSLESATFHMRETEQAVATELESESSFLNQHGITFDITAPQVSRREIYTKYMELRKQYDEQINAIEQAVKEEQEFFNRDLIAAPFERVQTPDYSRIDVYRTLLETHQKESEDEKDKSSAIISSLHDDIVVLESERMKLHVQLDDAVEKFASLDNSIQVRDTMTDMLEQVAYHDLEAKRITSQERYESRCMMYEEFYTRDIQRAHKGISEALHNQANQYTFQEMLKDKVIEFQTNYHYPPHDSILNEMMKRNTAATSKIYRCIRLTTNILNACISNRQHPRGASLRNDTTGMIPISDIKQAVATCVKELKALKDYLNAPCDALVVDTDPIAQFFSYKLDPQLDEALTIHGKEAAFDFIRAFIHEVTATTSSILSSRTSQLDEMLQHLLQTLSLDLFVASQHTIYNLHQQLLQSQCQYEDARVSYQVELQALSRLLEAQKQANDTSVDE